MLDTAITRPPTGRIFTARRRIRLSDMDANGRPRLDAIARLIQDAAIDDAQEAGWGLPDHLWVIRRIQVDAVSPLERDRSVEITTWSSGVAAIAAGRRWSVVGDAGGRVEIDSIWIHLDRDLRPSRIGDFGPYAEAARGRTVSTKVVLPDPPLGAPRSPWALRSTDLDAHGHVNNAVYWQAVEDRLAPGGTSLVHPYRAMLDFRDPIDLGDSVELAGFDDGDARRCLAFLVGDRVRAVASLGSARG